MEFCGRIKELRLEKKLSQSAMAEVMNVDQTTISTWEKGTRQPDYMTLKKLCLFFGVSADFLIGLEDEDGSRSS